MVTTDDVKGTFGELEDYYGGGSSTIPAEFYGFEIVEAEVRQGKDSGNWYVHYQARVTEGEFENRRVFDNLHLSATKADGSPSKSPQMTRMMLRLMLGDIPESVAAISSFDMEQLAQVIAAEIVGATFRGHTSIEKAEADSGYDDKNRLDAPRKNEL